MIVKKTDSRNVRLIVLFCVCWGWKQIEADGFRGPNDTVVCNIDDESSLVTAFQLAKVVLNCTGPYRFLGERCVEAALTAGTNIMDISGEPQVAWPDSNMSKFLQWPKIFRAVFCWLFGAQYMEGVFMKFHQEAESKGILVLNACAFDSVPADLGYLFITRQFKTESHCNAVESFLQIHAGVHDRLLLHLQRCSLIVALAVMIGADGMRGHYTTYEVTNTVSHSHSHEARSFTPLPHTRSLRCMDLVTQTLSEKFVIVSKTI